MNNKTVLLILIIFLAGRNYTQDNNITAEQSPKINYYTDYPAERNIWDIQLNFIAGEQNAGAEFDGTFFYSTRWASNLICKYTNTGVLVEQFSIPGVNGLRDLAFDGQFMYGGTNTNIIFRMDFNTKSLLGLIYTPVSVRHIAYDPGNDAFWIGNWATEIVLVSRSGEVLSTIPSYVHGLTSMYGSAYDAFSSGGPYLWVFDQGAGPGHPQFIHQLQLPQGAPTGIMHDVISDVGLGNTSAIAGGLFTTFNFEAGIFSLGGLLQGVPDRFFLYEIASIGLPCPVGKAENPYPFNGALNVPITLQTLSWTNPSGANKIEVYFDNLKIYDGPLITSIEIPNSPLNYFTTYTWKVAGKNDTCSGLSDGWSFKTEQIPGVILCDNFSQMNWIAFGPQGLTNWSLNNSSNAGGTPPELRFNWSPSFNGESILLSPVFNLPVGTPFTVSFKHMVIHDNPGYTLSAGYTLVQGYMLNELWSVTPAGNIGPELVTIPVSFYGGNIQWYFRIDGDSNQVVFWNIDDWCAVFVPVELVSVTAAVHANNITLNWLTASETNNKLFEIERSFGEKKEFIKIGSVQGKGTTTEKLDYSFIDKNLKPGAYLYRLKQIDYDGTFEYSYEVEAVVEVPSSYSLEQNYPNPFNPSTTVSFGLPVDSKVVLKIYNVLGEEIVTLLNVSLPAGLHKTEFDASNLNSGVYFYRINAKGADGSSFASVKKMIINK